jgi:hypothetical protein
MKLTSLIILLSGLFSPIGDTETEDALLLKQSEIASASYLNTSEKAMVWEINLVRADPQAYIPFIQEEMTDMRKDSARLSGIVSESITTRVEEIDGQQVISKDTVYKNFYADRMAALSELLLELGSAVPMEGLVPHMDLYTAAVKHGDSQAETRYIDHRGRDGSWPHERHQKENPEFTDGNQNIVRYRGTPREVVIQLLIDSGVPHRGHRRNILDPRWKYVTCHHVRQLDEGDVQWWIQEFAY